MTASHAPAGVVPVHDAFRLERDGSTGILWFDLPEEKVNKLSSGVVAALEAMLDEIAAARDLERLIILSGKDNIFIAGADIAEFRSPPSAAEAEVYVRWGQSVYAKLRGLPQVTVAVIHGACMGGGTELALNCDHRLATDWAKTAIALPEVKLGILPAWSGTTRLPRLVGLRAALDIILTGRAVVPNKAKAIGLVDAVIPGGIRLDAAKKFIATKRGKRSAARTSFLFDGNPIGRSIVFSQARKRVVKQTGGHYPAPLRILDVMKAGDSRGVDAGLAAEAKAAGELIMGEVAQNLVGLFFMMEGAKRWDGPAPARVNRAGVVGAGLMGGGITQCLVDKAGIPVRMKDINWDALASGMRSAAKIWKKKVGRRRMKQTEMDVKLAHITTTTEWSGFDGVDVVIEAVVEKLPVKQQVLREFEKVSKASAIFATNTSTIPITMIAEAANRPENVIGMHFFSPVDRMPLVEVIVGKKTSVETTATIVELAKRMGKTVVVCHDGPGFVVNRILGPYLNEAGLLLEEGNTIDSIDSAMVEFGMPLGPLALLDEVGIDVAGKAAQVLAEAFGARMKVSAAIEKLLADQRYGKKNARGVYRWKEGKRTEPDPSVYQLLGVENPKPGNPRTTSERMVLAMINEAALLLDEAVAASAADIDLAMILGTGFPPFRGGLMRYADSLGIPYVVARLDDLQHKAGPRFTPCEPLRRLAERGGTFY